MDTRKLEKLARRMVGRDIKIQVGAGIFTDGSSITVIDPDASWPELPSKFKDNVTESVTGHEAGHIVHFERIAKKMNRPSVSAEEFYQIFADPLSPGADSRDYVRFMMNVVEDQLADDLSAKFVGKDTLTRVNRFLVWNRQGGTRPSVAELESQESDGKCAAFIEALFQFEIYGELIEGFFSGALERAAKEANKAIESFGQGALSRQQALQRVLDALRKYCPPPWRMPPKYQPPQGGGGQGQGGAPGQPGGQGNGSSQPDAGAQPGQGSPGQGQPGPRQNGQSQQGNQSPPKAGEGDQQGQGQGDGDSSSSDGSSKGEGNKSPKEDSKEGDGKSASQGESQAAGQGTPSESESRGAETGGEAGAPRPVDRQPERTFEDNNLEALLKMLERVLAERAKQQGRGIPRWHAWLPGEPVKDPDAITRYYEDEYFGIDPLKRRVVRRRDRERHLLAIFIDSSGSVNDKLFSQLYRVCGELAEKVADLDGCFLGVGQFSGGASWVLEPTREVTAIREFAETEPKRLYSGGTTVGEIYGLLPEWFAGYETADLIVLTDGFVENGKMLAESLERAHLETQCEIKLHGVIFKGSGQELKQFRKAKQELPEFIRIWHLGDEEA